MRYFIIGVWLGACIIGLCFGTQAVFAQKEGFLSPQPTDASYENMLPPGAVYEGTDVLHKIASEQENLHLLSGYYYGNTRQWKKIYQDNRDIIKNPNRLPVGQTIRIQVGEGWRPRFSYQEWFNLATRNGEWKPGQPWQRASKVPMPAPKPAATQETPASREQEAPATQKTPEAETSETPEGPSEGTPAAKETPVAEETPTEEKPEEETSDEETSEEETPAEPAF
jgi:hypothetical protein